MLASDALDRLQQIVGTAGVSLTASDRQHHGRDQSSHPLSLPDAVAWPESTAQVSAIAALAHEARIPLVGWGAGTSLEGNSIPLFGGIVVDFSRMNRILAVHDQDFQVTVQPGLLYKDMNHELARFGLFFPPDPGANASLGGMIANNAAGSRTVKYGATRDNVLALEVVLAGGEIIRTGSRSVKQSAGYDLTHLFTGSEGTLGLITEATLKLAPLPAHFSVATAAFPTVAAAAEAVFGIMGSGLNPAALELIDGSTISILEDSEGLGLTPDTPYLFMEFTGASQVGLEAALQLVREICDESGCLAFQSGLGLDARLKLWEARHRLFEVMVRTFPGQTYRITDVAVPISSYPALVGYAAASMADLGLAGGMVGHAGDGNLHTVAFFPPDDPESEAAADSLNDQLAARAIALGGTCTGEHGVGIGKTKYMVHEHGEAAVALMRRLKEALDPHHILNPGKIFGEIA